LKKTYPKATHQAITGNTFGVRKGEIFGMLGPNGAGKSTTFSIMALDIPKTSGYAEVLNTRVEDLNILEQGPWIGLCPQYNTLWE
jgi:ABC-type multidrug transport system ATPase subunit